MQTHLNGFGCELMHGYCCAFCKLSVLHMLFPALFRVHMALTTDSPEASRLRNMCCSTFPATSGLSYSVLRLEAKDRPPHMVKQCPTSTEPRRHAPHPPNENSSFDCNLHQTSTFKISTLSPRPPDVCSGILPEAQPRSRSSERLLLQSFGRTT